MSSMLYGSVKIFIALWAFEGGHALQRIANSFLPNSSKAYTPKIEVIKWNYLSLCLMSLKT